MPIYEYQGQQYNISTTDPTEAKNKILAHLGKSEAPKSVSPKIPTPDVSTGEAVGAGFLGSALGLSRFFGGDVAESQTKAREAEEVAMEQRPIATSVGKFIPSVIAAAPVLLLLHLLPQVWVYLVLWV